jgi:hypothetical protein
MTIGYESIQVYATLSRVSFSIIPFKQYNILVPPLPTGHPQKGKLPDGQFCTG